MINQIRYTNLFQGLLRLIRVEDYSTFTQLIIGYVLAGGSNIPYLLGTLAILGPCIYGGLYALNDVHDHDADRQHPIKRKRPIAAGIIDPQTGSRIGVSLISFGIGIALAFDPKVLVLALLFLIINLTYTFRVKQMPYLEIIFNTITHPLRFAAGVWIAGGEGHWLLLSIWTLAAFVLSVLKRIKEMRESSIAARPVLKHYKENGLKILIVFCMTLMLGLWPFTSGWDFILTDIWLALSLIAVVGYFYIPFIKQIEDYCWR
jgi:decaprenyl-phosphate phosphoribosyltransferase